MSENKLTNEEISRVFAMYYGQRVLKFSKTAPATQICDCYMLGRINNDCVISLTPLSAITDEHAIEVAKICNFDNKTLTMCKYNSFENLQDIGKRIIEYYLYNEIKDGFNTHGIWFNINDFNWFLILKGYAVPLWFGLNHWANGKTAIELEVAIDRTKI